MMPTYCTKCQIEMNEIQKDVELIDNGDQFIIPNVRAYRCGICNRIAYDVEALMKGRVINILRKNGLYSNDSPVLLLLYAPGIKNNHEEIHGITLLQKEEFYFKEGLKDKSLVVPFPIFRPMQGGPWDPNLDQRLDRMIENQLICVSKHSAGPDKFVDAFRLSEDGITLGEKIWSIYPQFVRKEAEKVKKRLNSLSAKEVVDLVHDEYPDMWDRSKPDQWDTE